MQGNTSVLQMTFVVIVKVLISSLITVWACTDIIMIQKRHGGVALSHIIVSVHFMLVFPTYVSHFNPLTTVTPFDIV